MITVIVNSAISNELYFIDTVSIINNLSIEQSFNSEALYSAFFSIHCSCYHLPDLHSLISSVLSSINWEGSEGSEVAAPINSVVSNSHSFCYLNQVSSIHNFISMCTSNNVEASNLSFIHKFYCNTYNPSTAAFILWLWNYINYILPLLIYLAHMLGFKCVHFFKLMLKLIFLCFDKLVFAIKLFKSSQCNSNIAITLMLFKFISLSNANPSSSNDVNKEWALKNVTIGILISYLFTNWLYDYLYFKLMIAGNPSSVINYLAYRLILGISFLINIFAGVLGSTGFWLLTSGQGTIYRIVGTIICYIVSYMFSTLWIHLGKTKVSFRTILSIDTWFPWTTRPHIFISLLRSLCEATAFTSLSWSTFAIWNFWQMLDFPLKNLCAFFLGLVIYGLGVYFQIFIEKYFEHMFLYGLVYSISFTGLALSTNGLFFLMFSNIPAWAKILSTVIAGIIITTLPMQYYRNTDLNPILRLGRDHEDRSWFALLLFILYSLYLYALFYCFAHFTYMIFLYISFMN